MKAYRLNFSPLVFWILLAVFISIFGFFSLVKFVFWFFITIVFILPLIIYLLARFFKWRIMGNLKSNYKTKTERKHKTIDTDVIDVKATKVK